MSNTAVRTPKVLTTQKEHRQNLIVRFNLLIIFIALFIVASIIAPEFLSTQNLANLLQQSSLIGIVAVGMTLVILTAGIDLSVGSVAALAGMLVAIFIGFGIPWPIALLLAVAAGAVSGAIVGSLSAYLQLPAFMVTHAALQSVRGLT
jgi:ribose transport system permease protein